MEKELPMYYRVGLNDSEVQERIAKGQVNGVSKPVSKSYGQIIKDNVCTLFNLLNFLIFVALVFVQAWSNLVFMAIIVTNSVIGIWQEVKAKKLVDQLSILTKPTIMVVRNSRHVIVDINEVVLDDVLVLESGNQVCNDATVIHGMIEANESLLTGESDPIHKNIGGHLLSGSSVVSGKCYARVKNVGDSNYATTIVKEAQKVKEKNSELMDSMNKVTKVTTFMIIPLGIILFVEAMYLRQDTLFNAVVSSAAGLLGMLPKGLVLLTSVSLANGVTRLARRKVLIQDLYSLETLSHVDVLCLDKTGTITQGKMTVKGLKLLSERFTKEDLERLLAAYMQHSKDNNATAQAIRNAYEGLEHHYQVGDIIPFSSDRKWGAMSIDGVGTLFLGAPEMLLKENPKAVDQAQARGSRVLILAWSQSAVDTETMSLPNDVEALTLLEIADPIREDAAETLEYLRSEDVTLKIISGDNPVTVSHIAHQAGFADYQSYIDCSKVSDEELEALAEDTAIFGRVSPHQKKLLIQTLNANGHTTAMTGDGVNDILALREADCSIVMAEGDPATRQIANLVLMDSEFKDIPEILFEGRRVVNNIAHIAPIFLIKTVYSFLLGLICIASIVFGKAEYLLVFPFIQVQMTLAGQFIEGLPPFILTFERNIRPVEKHFLRRSLQLSIPNALMLVISVLIFHLSQVYLGMSNTDMLTLSYYMMGSTGVLAVIRACIPLNKGRVALIIYSVFGFLISSYYLRDVIEISTLNSYTLPIYLVAMAICTPLFFWISYKQGAFQKA